MQLINSGRSVLALVSIMFAALLGGGAGALLGTCGPFTDTANDAFCGFILEVYYLGITTGTTPTTYSPADNVSRTQMAAFLSRSVDGVLKRGNRRAALKQFWTPQNATVLGITTVGVEPQLVESDGADVWVANFGSNSISRVRGSDGALLATWTGATRAVGIAVAMGRILVSGSTNPGELYLVDPTQGPGAVTTVASNLGAGPNGIAFDGARIWTADGASVSIVTPGATMPWTVTMVTTGFTAPFAVLYDGVNIWVTNQGVLTSRLLRLDTTGAILQTVTVGRAPSFPVFDGANIWVPNFTDSSVSVVRASSGAVLQTLTGNSLSGPLAAAFDGQRVLITNNTGGNGASLFKAADLTPAGAFSTGDLNEPFGACSDGVNFWISLSSLNQLARF